MLFTDDKFTLFDLSIWNNALTLIKFYNQVQIIIIQFYFEVNVRFPQKTNTSSPPNTQK